MKREHTTYDDIPMTFCIDCLWHGNVDTVEINGKSFEYCPHCGCTTFKTAPAYKWDEMFRFKYKRPSFYKCKESWTEIVNDGISKEDAELMNLFNL